MKYYRVTYKVLHLDSSKNYQFEEDLVVVENLWNELAEQVSVLEQVHQAPIEALAVWEVSRCSVCGEWWECRLLHEGVCRDCRSTMSYL